MSMLERGNHRLRGVVGDLKAGEGRQEFQAPIEQRLTA